MTAELAGFKHGVAERFVPDLMRGTLIEAEHVARYRWAAQVAAGRRVLDAGCGTGYGCVLLAEGGAEDVVGVDIAAEVLDSVRSDMPDAVRLDVADVAELPYADGEFDLVVCFDVVEHLEDPGRALDEMVRVLAGDGVLLVSTPNRAVYSPDSPHHRHEYLPEELGEELRARLGYVTMMRQDVYLTTAVLGDAEFLAGGSDLVEITVHKIATGEPDGEEFTLAVAGRTELPELPPLAVMAGSLQVKRWLAAFGEQRAMAAANHARILELEDLASRVADLDAELARVREEKAGALVRAEQAERVLTDVWRSLSWRLTSPLRRVKASVRSAEALDRGLGAEQVVRVGGAVARQPGDSPRRAAIRSAAHGHGSASKRSASSVSAWASATRCGRRLGSSPAARAASRAIARTLPSPALGPTRRESRRPRGQSSRHSARAARAARAARRRRPPP